MNDTGRFVQDLREGEIVRNGKRMRWDDKSKSFKEIKDSPTIGKKK